MSENNIEKLGAAIASIEKSIGSALELGEKVTSLDADLQAVRKEQAEAVAALKADGQKIPEAVDVLREHGIRTLSDDEIYTL